MEQTSNSTEDAKGVGHQPLVLPLDRDGRDDDAPDGYPATNEDGTTPIVDGDTIYIRQYYCSCGQGCGGCRISSFPHPIDGKRFHWQNDQGHRSCDDKSNPIES